MSYQRSGRDDPRFREIQSVNDYYSVDLARTHSFIEAADSGIDAQQLQAEHEQLMRDGYIILENVASPEQLEALKQESSTYLDNMGRNSFGWRRRAAIQRWRA